MSGHLKMDDKTDEYGSVHGLGEQVRCFRDGGAVVREALNGWAKAFYRDNPNPERAEKKEGQWSICRVDANGARCWNEFRGV